MSGLAYYVPMALYLIFFVLWNRKEMKNAIEVDENYRAIEKKGYGNKIRK